MTRIRLLASISVVLSGLFFTAPAQTPAGAPQDTAGAAARDLYVGVGKSLVVDSPVVIQRVAVANGEVAEAVAVNPREVLVNGRAQGETSLIIWQQGGNRLIFDLKVRPDTTNIEAVRRELNKELPGQDVAFTFENNTVFLRGTVNDVASADRAVVIASTLGKTVNLLRVKVPAVDAQVLLKVKFANVDRNTSSQLGANIFLTGALNTVGSTTVGSFTPPQVGGLPSGGSTTSAFTLTDALNIFIFRRDLDLGTTIRALQGKNLLQVLAEPNVLAMNGKPASFLAGGEFPFPVVQGGAAVGSVTIQFREFGVRINFLPTVTPRGTIRLQVTPEVSSLDFSNGLVFQGFNIPAISTRRVQTEIELDDGQSFAIGGLLDNRVVENLAKIPGLGDIPLFGKLFRTRTLNKNNSELLVMVTPELVRPIPVGQPRPEVKARKEWLDGTPGTMPRTPGIDVTGPVPVTAVQESLPYEQFVVVEKPPQGASTPPPAAAAPAPAPPAAAPQAQPAAPKPPAAAPRPGGTATR